MEQRGEQLFASFLDRSGVPYVYEPQHAHKSRRPDFVVNWRGTECLFEVKDREMPVGRTVTPEDLERLDIRSLVPERIPPYRWIRNKIEKGRVKFSEFKGSSCALVLYAASGFTSDLTSSHFALGAMYGDVAIQVGRGSTNDELVFLGNGKMTTSSSGARLNTTISALITLRTVDIGAARRRRLRRLGTDPIDWTRPDEIPAHLMEEQLGVIVWENVFAATPLPRDLFIGAFDERWSRSGDSICRTYVGRGLAEYYADR